MAHGITTTMTVAAVMLHAIVGCCAHHGHAHGAERESHVVESAVGNCGHACGCGRSSAEPESDLGSAGSEAPLKEGPCECESDGFHFVFVHQTDDPMGSLADGPRFPVGGIIAFAGHSSDALFEFGGRRPAGPVRSGLSARPSTIRAAFQVWQL